MPSPARRIGTSTSFLPDKRRPAAISSGVSTLVDSTASSRVASYASSIATSATVDAPATGSVAFQSTQLGEPAQSNPNTCMFYFDPAQDEASRLSQGKIWVTFVCPEMNINTNVCEINQAWAVFENCDTGAEE